MKFEVTNKTRLQGYLTLSELDREFDLYEYIALLDDVFCTEGPFTFIEQIGDIQHYICETCKTEFSSRESFPVWKHFKRVKTKK